jgi:hypothetical protein
MKAGTHAGTYHLPQAKPSKEKAASKHKGSCASCGKGRICKLLQNLLRLVDQLMQ